MSVNSAVTVLRPMAKVVGLSLSLTLIILASELAFGEAGSVSSSMIYKEMGKFFYQTLGSHLCSLGKKRDPEGSYYMVGVRMLEKAKKIWSIADGETNYEDLSPDDKRLIILKSAKELQQGKRIMHRSYCLLCFGLTVGMIGNLFSVPLGSLFVVPSI